MNEEALSFEEGGAVGMGTVLLFFLASVVALGQVEVTSQEQFKRLKQSGTPENINYDFDRAYLSARDSQNCPPHSKAFFSVHINKDGEVKRVKGRLVALSRDLSSIALNWASALLKQLEFKPLMYGTKPSSVNMAVTLVCEP